MPTVYTEVEVDVELTDFDTDDLIEELERRGEMVIADGSDHKEQVEQMYNLFRAGKREQIDDILRDLFYNVLGRIA